MKTVCAFSLSLLLLLAVGIEGLVTSRRNNCQCKTTNPGKHIQLENVIDFKVLQRSASCDKDEYIVTITLKKKLIQMCLEPSPDVQELYKKYRALKKTQYRRRRH